MHKDVQSTIGSKGVHTGDASTQHGKFYAKLTSCEQWDKQATITETKFEARVTSMR